MNVEEIKDKVNSKKVSATEVLEQYINTIEKKDKDINAFITLSYDSARRLALEVDKRIALGEYLPLAGVVLGVKDNICTKDILTTCASKMLSNFVPTYDATVIKHLKDAGAIIVGKTNMDEFAMGSTTESSFFKPTKNPHNLARVPGGSSGGSAASVAALEVACAIGSDTGGSIRQPASYCGVVGLKPTYGTISRNGLIAYASSFDQIGPIATNTRDCALLLEQMSKPCDKDSTYFKRKDNNFSKHLVNDIKGLRIGVPYEFFGDELNSTVKEKILDAIKVLEKAGAKVSWFSLGLTEYAIFSYYIIACAQASSNLSRFDGVKYGFRAKDYDGLNDMYKKTRSCGFGREVIRRIMLGSFVLSEGYYDDYYLKALKARNMISREFDKAFLDFDVIISPVAPNTAPKFLEYEKDYLAMYLSDYYTVMSNLCGNCGISIPVGFDACGMPIGMQIMGQRFREDNILRTAYTYERQVS